MNGFVSFCFPSLTTRGEKQIIRANANHTVLIPPPTHTRRILQCPRSQLISAGRDPNRSDLIRYEKTTARFNGRASIQVFYKILKFSGSSLPGMTSITDLINSGSISSLGVFTADVDCHIFSAGACKHLALQSFVVQFKL